MAKRTGARSSAAKPGESIRVPDAGDLIWLSFSPQAGREQAGRRPALVISPQSYNAKVGLCLACPITHQAKGYPFEIALPPGLPIQGVVLADHIKSADWRERRWEQIAKAPAEVLDELARQVEAIIGYVSYNARMASDSDRVLIGQIRQGDPQAWQQLIDRYEGRLLAFAERRLRDRAASEDVVQEAFIGFLNSLPNFDDRRELQTYLFTIAAHKITDQLRRKGRRPWHATGGDDGDDALQNQQDSGQPHASSQARSHERKDIEDEAIARCLGTMLRGWMQKGDYQRVQVLELIYVKGMANRDVAAALGITEQQVANYRFAATRKLADLIREAGLPPDVFPELCEPPEE